MRPLPNILLIGDDTLEMRHLRTIFSRAARVAQAEDLPDAFQKLAAMDYDMVIADWSFHCGTWQAALRQIRAVYPALPVIVLSRAEGLEQSMREWVSVVEEGAFDVLAPRITESAAMALMEHAVATGEARAMRATA
jgi:DNA-binding NtrC family response regulator